MNVTNCVLPPAPLFCHHLQMALANTLERNTQCYEAQVLLTQDCLEELEWWNTNMSRWNGKTLLKQDIDIVIDSVASLEGWGAHCFDQRTGGLWSRQEHVMHINCLELLAVTLATKTFAKSKIHLAENRQHHDSSLYKQPWSLQGVSAAYTRSVDVVPRKEYPHYSSTPTRGNEYNSRH